MYFKKALTAISVSLLLSACGGSDKNNGIDAITPDFSYANISLQSEIQLDEKTSDTVIVDTNYKGDKKLTYSIENYNSLFFTAEITDNIISINAMDLTDREFGVIELTISVTDGSTIKSEEITVVIKNTSYIDTLKQVNDDYALGTDILSLDHESTVFTWAVDLAYLYEGISLDDRAYLKELYELQVTGSRSELRSFINGDLVNLLHASVAELEEVNASEISESFNLAVSEYSKQVKKTFERINRMEIESVPEIKLNELTYVNGIASFFYGNRNMGSYGKDDQWVFVKPYEKFEKLIPISREKVCRISDNASEE